MPTPPPLRRAARLSRRTAVGGGRGAGGRRRHGLHAARDRRAAPGPTPARDAAPRDTDPDVALAATVLADEQAMLDRVLATVAGTRDLGTTLAGGPDRAHRARRPARRRPCREDAAPPRRPTPVGAPHRPPAAGATRVPARAASALAALAREEDGLSLLGRRSAFAAESGAFARVLASMAAAAAQQARALADAAGGAR